MAVATNFRTVFWLSLCLALGACGGGGGDDSSNDSGGPAAESPDGTDDPSTETPDDPDTPDTPDTPAEGAPTVTVDSDIKQLQFSWDPQEGDAYYVLSENPDGASGFTDIPDENNTDTTQTIPVAVHHHDWANATYIVEACNASDECVPSAQVTTEAAMLSAIGYFKASNPGIEDEFGQSVALSDDGMTLAVGAHKEDSSGDESDDSANSAGAVYIFVLSDSGWVQEAYIKAASATAEDDFGHSVALSADGNTLAVGATRGGEELNTGVVHVFTRADGTWSEDGAALGASNAEPNDRFGFSVDLNDGGDLLAVGAPGGDIDSTDGGAATAPIPGGAYLFSRAGDGLWSETAFPVPDSESDDESDDLFGYDVALSGDGMTLVVGAPQESGSVGGSPVTEAGAAYVYVYNQETENWSSQALNASTVTANAHFGYSLAISTSGDTFAVGASGNREETVEQAGTVHIFSRNVDSWDTVPLTAPQVEPRDYFGSSLAISNDGNILAVGASWEDSTATGIGGEQGSNTAPNSGAVYLFSHSASGWTQTAYVKASYSQEHSFFGHSVALDASGDTLAIGAIGENGKSIGIGGDPADQFPDDETTPGDNVAAGAVYLY